MNVHLRADFERDEHVEAQAGVTEVHQNGGQLAIAAPRLGDFDFDSLKRRSAGSGLRPPV